MILLYYRLYYCDIDIDIILRSKIRQVRRTPLLTSGPLALLPLVTARVLASVLRLSSTASRAFFCFCAVHFVMFRSHTKLGCTSILLPNVHNVFVHTNEPNCYTVGVCAARGLEGSPRLPAVDASDFRFLLRDDFSTPAARRRSSDMFCSHTHVLSVTGEDKEDVSFTSSGIRTSELPSTGTIESPVEPLAPNVAYISPRLFSPNFCVLPADSHHHFRSSHTGVNRRRGPRGRRARHRPFVRVSERAGREHLRCDGSGVHRGWSGRVGVERGFGREAEGSL